MFFVIVHVSIDKMIHTRHAASDGTKYPESKYGSPNNDFQYDHDANHTIHVTIIEATMATQPVHQAAVSFR